MIQPFFSLAAYHDYLSPAFARDLLARSQPVPGVPRLRQLGSTSGLETPEALSFLAELYAACEQPLAKLLKTRKSDRRFVDQRAPHASVLGLQDAQGRVVFGPLSPQYSRAGGKPIAPLPSFLQGPHVTLFGPPDSAKMAINAMNAYHRKLPGEPPIVEELLRGLNANPFWGADDEDSKTPIRADLVDAAVNLTACFQGTLEFAEGSKRYELASDHLSLPIKRFPGLALPSSFLFFDENPIPLHLYDFALHLFHNYRNPRALAFYVPKLENEEEARYIHHMIQWAETRLQALDSSYQAGSVRLMIVLENPRAILRTHEIIDALHPYFAGASLGWHDYLASTARLFKEVAAYRIPVKADPDIVIKYIQASHRLLADVVGKRGAIQVGGMYGILPQAGHPESLQVTLRGFFRDVITQMKRDLTGFWVAHPDFVRLGLALVAAWKLKRIGQDGPLRKLVEGFFDPARTREICDFIDAPDIEGLDPADPHYVRSLIVADIEESDFIPNNHPDEIRYNVFQSLQYLADWLAGNGCVALPTSIGEIPVRVMDDLATAERSRWEVWAELRHGRFSLEDFIQIAHEEMNFIRRDLSDDKKIVQVKWDDRTRAWYPIAYRILLKLMTDREPAEFATELLLPFTSSTVRESSDPWAAIQAIDPHKYALREDVAAYDHAFEICGNHRFAHALSMQTLLNEAELRSIVEGFSREEIIGAAHFHGDIGQAKSSLDARAAREQSGVLNPAEQSELRTLGDTYRKKFGFKFLISAQGQSGASMLAELKRRLSGSEASELHNARAALWEITRKRLHSGQFDLSAELDHIRSEARVPGVSIAVSRRGSIQAVTFGEGVDPDTYFQLASLSKPISAAFALDYFRKRNIPLTASVQELLTKSGSELRLKGPRADFVRVRDLLAHSALNLHYVSGLPKTELLPLIEVISEPGTRFQYSGGGYLVLEHLLETLEGAPIEEILRPFFRMDPPDGARLACGTLDGRDGGDGVPLPQGHLRFPVCAAGGWATARQMAEFLGDLTAAFQGDATPRISHDTAVEMLQGSDLGCREFMGCQMGLGIFVAEAGPNRLVLHQGANEGFRALFVHCTSGPDQGKGIVILANGDNRAVPMIAKMARALLEAMQFQGIDFSRLADPRPLSDIPQEQIVNQGYKALIFDAFEPDLPEPIIERGPLDPNSTRNLAVGARVLSVTNQKFARAENLVSPHEPVFDPELFGRQGKIMDSWETARHNPLGRDSLILELTQPARFRFVTFSTRFHDGNHPERAALQGWDGKSWREVLAPTPLQGHAMHVFDLGDLTPAYTRVRVEQYPDGGLTRLGLFEKLPDNLKLGVTRYSDEIPKTRKPLTLPFQASGDLRVARASNEHYGPAAQVLSPYPPLHMFDGFESARSRQPGHHEELEIHLERPTRLSKVRLEFTYFVNNNPQAVSLHAKRGSDWMELVPQTPVKAYAGNFKEFEIHASEPIQDLLVKVYPDGGINRIRVLGSPA